MNRSTFSRPSTGRVGSAVRAVTLNLTGARHDSQVPRPLRYVLQSADVVFDQRLEARQHQCEALCGIRNVADQFVGVACPTGFLDPHER